MAWTDFLTFFIANPWIILIIGAVSGSLIIVQLLFFNTLRKRGVDGIPYIFAGFTVAAVTFILFTVFWLTFIYAPGGAIIWISFMIFIIIIGPISSTVLVTIGFYKLSKTGQLGIVKRPSVHSAPPF